MLLTSFLVLATLTFFFLCVIWSREGINIFFKMFFGALTAWGLACTLMQLGFHK